MSHDGVVDDAASIGSGSDSSGDDWEAPPTVEGHSTYATAIPLLASYHSTSRVGLPPHLFRSYNLAFEWSDGSSGGGDDAAGRPPAAEVKQTPALDCDAIKKVSHDLPSVCVFAPCQHCRCRPCRPSRCLPARSPLGRHTCQRACGLPPSKKLLPLARTFAP
jgi:hypothetical protein